jgi:hypothetical protein
MLTNDPSVRAGEDCSCLRPRGHRDRLRIVSVKFICVTTCCRHYDLKRCNVCSTALTLDARFRRVAAHYAPSLHHIQLTITANLPNEKGCTFQYFGRQLRVRNTQVGVAQCLNSMPRPSDPSSRLLILFRRR